MAIELVIVGGGGFGREAVDVLRAINRHSLPERFKLVGVVDSMPSEFNLEKLGELGVPYLGTEQDWLAKLTNHAPQYVVAIGSPHLRAEVVRRFVLHGLEAATLIHPSSVIGSNSKIYEGTIICAGVNISTNVRIGAHSHLNPASVIGHDVVLEGLVSINPSATVSGNVLIENGCLVGAGAVILQNLNIGNSSTIGAGAVVVHDVPSGAVVKGVPAR